MTATDPTLAVVIPNYNYGHYLQQALDSVLAQTPPFDEIIVVDDGSTDNSREVLAHYVGRVKVLCIPNGGQMGACWAGIRAATSDYIYSMDADDYAAPGIVEQVKAVLTSHPVKVQFQLHSVAEDGTAYGSSFPTYPSGYDAAAMKTDNSTVGFYICPPTSGNVFSRRVIEQLPMELFDPRSAFDGAPVLAMPYLGEIISLNEPLAHYRVHTNSMSSWAKPTTAILQREISIFWKTWDEVASAIRLEKPLFIRSQPLYVSERQMMIACKEHKLFIMPEVLRFFIGLPRTHLPLKQKLIFACWAFILLIPSSNLREYCIGMKRSSANRSKRLRAIVSFIQGWRNR
jgi:glycosyltransferase involved in cell wall biosynthesis